VSSKFPCLTVDGTGDSCGTSAMIPITAFFYVVSSIFSSESSCFWPNKVGFFAKSMVIDQHFVSFAIFSCQSGIYAQKQCFW
jgi:hypothetical protein